MAQLTRQEIETRLEEKYLGRVISIEMPMTQLPVGAKPTYFGLSGKIQRLGVDTVEGEPMVIFKIGTKRYKADVNYFIENTTIHGNPQ